VVGLVVGGLFAWLGQAVKHGRRPVQPPSGLAVALMSLSEELFALAGVVVTALFAPLGYLFAIITTWLYTRLGIRRRRRYRPDGAKT